MERGQPEKLCFSGHLMPKQGGRREQESETNAGTSFTAVIKEKWRPPAPPAQEAQAQAAKKRLQRPWQC